MNYRLIKLLASIIRPRHGVRSCPTTVAVVSRTRVGLASFRDRDMRDIITSQPFRAFSSTSMNADDDDEIEFIDKKNE